MNNLENYTQFNERIGSKGKKIKGVEYGKFKGKTYTGKIISHIPGEKIRYI